MNTLITGLFMMFATTNSNPSLDTAGYYFEEHMKTVEAKPLAQSVKFASGVNFIMYSFLEEELLCHYILEKKINGTNWEVVAIKEGVKSPAGQKLTYYFRDTVNNQQACEYRVKKMYKEKKLIADPAKFATANIKSVAFNCSVVCTGNRKCLDICLSNTYSHVKLMLFSQNGELVGKQNFYSASQLEYDGAHLSNGLYYVVIETDGVTHRPQTFVL